MFMANFSIDLWKQGSPMINYRRSNKKAARNNIFDKTPPIYGCPQVLVNKKMDFDLNVDGSESDGEDAGFKDEDSVPNASELFPQKFIQIHQEAASLKKGY